jgi:mono/diheme cytochrome c family protein
MSRLRLAVYLKQSGRAVATRSVCVSHRASSLSQLANANTASLPFRSAELSRAAGNNSPIRAVLIVAITFATSAIVRAQDLDNGRTEFLSRCAGCHGADGKGAGPMTSKLKRKPVDLTALARNNNGVFSAGAMAAIIDGRGAVRHRRLEMPIWGCRQGPPPGPQRKAYQPKPIDSLLDMPCDPEEVTRRRILEIVEYLRRIQEK